MFEAFTYIKTDSCSHCREHYCRICDCGVYFAEKSDRRWIDGLCHHFESFLRVEHFFGRADFQWSHVFHRSRVVGKEVRVDDDPEHDHFPDVFDFFRTVPALQNMTDDILLSAIYAGILCGLGVGLVFKVGASTGGMDIPPLLLNKHFRIPVAVGMYTFDVIFLLIQAFFSSMEQILYGLIMVFLTSIVINKVMVTGTNKMQLFIISKKFEEIKEALLYVQDVGLTLVNIETAFEGVQQQAVLCVIEQRKLSAINALVNDIDPFAFVIIGQVHEVAGKGFTLEREQG